MKARWKRSDITDEMVCRAYLPQMEARDAEQAVESRLTVSEILTRRTIIRNSDGFPIVEFADAVLQRNTGAPCKVVYAAIERACDRDLIEYGVTMRSGWLTEKGKAMVNPDGDPRAEGMEAAHCGKPETANPYDIDTHPDQHMDWNDGWADADEDE